MPESPIFAPDEVQLLAQGLFGDGVQVALAYPWAPPDDLHPTERSCLPHANDKRLGEFAAGRRAARMAMLALGHTPAPIVHQTDRSPRWPMGLAGSISHTDDICVAALAHLSDHAALGLDIEEDAALPEDLIREICTPSELAWLSICDPDLRNRHATLIFSAKECAYKVQYPLTSQVLEFDAFEITLDPETGQFEATFTGDVAPFSARDCLHGRFAFGANLVMTGLALPPQVA
ncbi:MAG: 4'-phosphopantetheinyl transferase [Roseovarius sp.]